jgi:hypothetical protein
MTHRSLKFYLLAAAVWLSGAPAFAQSAPATMPYHTVFGRLGDATNATTIGSGTLNTARLPAPFTGGSASGNTSKFGTVTGSLTNGHCASYDASGNLQDSGSSCGTSAMVLLNTLTASNSATLSDTSSLTATYPIYEIVFENIVPAPIRPAKFRSIPAARFRRLVISPAR